MRKLLSILALLAAGAGGGIAGWLHLTANATIDELMGENRDLRLSLSNLNEVEQVGYAKVVEQERRNGTLYTTLKLIQTDPRDPTQRLAEQTFSIEGDVVHFDALVVKFAPRLVESGEQRALFIWRRIYGEQQRPADGFAVTHVGEIPARYARLTERLDPDDAALFWQAVWQLAHDPSALEHLGVTAVYGNAVYTQLRPGLIYSLKANTSGQVWPEVFPAM